MPQQPSTNSNSPKSTYVQLPDNTYLEVPEGVSDQEVHGRIHSMFPEYTQSYPSTTGPFAPPAVGKPSVDMRKVYLNTGNPVPDNPAKDLLMKQGEGIARGVYSQTTPGLVHGLLKRYGVTQSGPDLMKETVPNAVGTFAGGLEGEGAEGGARPVERTGGNRPTPRSVPGRATPSKPKFGPLDAATWLPGMAGTAAKILKKFGVGETAEAAPEAAMDYGTPNALRGQKVKPGTLTLDKGIPKSNRPQPAWKSKDTSGSPVDSILNRNPEAGPAKPREGVSNNPGAPFPRKPSWQNLKQPEGNPDPVGKDWEEHWTPEDENSALEHEIHRGTVDENEAINTLLKRPLKSNVPTPESRAASDAAFAKNNPNSEFKSGMDPVAESTWQQSVFGSKPIEDIGTKVRAGKKGVPRTGTGSQKLTKLEREAQGEGPQQRIIGKPADLKLGAKPKLVSTADAQGRAIDNEAWSGVNKGEDARNLPTKDLSQRLMDAAKKANKKKNGKSQE